MTASDHRFPCDQCGADLRYSPDAGQLVCDHCGHREPVEDDARRTETLVELDYQATLDAMLPESEIEEIRQTRCTNCGAEFEMDEATHAAECPFCATPVVTGTGLRRRIKPRGVLPFALSEAEAHKAMTDWLGRLWFAPNGLKDYARKGRRMEGIYVPYWTFDADTTTNYRGQRGTVYYETRRVTRNGKTETVRVQRTRWRSVSGRVARVFDDVLVLASKSLPKRYTYALEPWDLSLLQPYQPQFLAGFRSEGYTIDLEDGLIEARQIMEQVIRRDAKFDIGGDRQRVDWLETRISTLTFKHVLLPVWLAAYRYRGKTYRFVVNGRNGRVQGERPWSAWKIAFAVGLVLAVVGGLAAGIGYLSALQQ
ncbi:TFIIB-type zinc finger domain-containing protein [Rhodovulum sulfidophilum]|uniref:TFIIB-type zinc finger domain-containing protein n=1 Tax=Rhodovulum sulfidophilum TaxID=35806 RepID=UPI001F42C054|nr:TFIIB-type zinc finger domain-containing protein [Rhodovulum sulfidophilum]MCE8440609.1 primosomal protein N' (replication factor Y) - superfamily II helicase [Rhodovulum sulfidophilum]